MKVRSVEIAIRGNSVECNRNSSRYKAVRVAGGRWVILSANDDIPEMVERAKALARSGEGVELADADMAVGEFRLGRGEFDEERAIELLSDLRDELGGFVEAVLMHEEAFREIRTDDGADAREVKVTTDLNVSLFEKGIASLNIGGLGGLDVVEEEFEFLTEVLRDRAEGLKKAKLVNPLMRGFKFDVILSREAACALVHEISHALEADVAGELERGGGITIYDRPIGFGGYNFDDEGVLAKEKCLVCDGRVLTRLHTRESAFKFGERPLGNGRGIFTIPKALQTNLFVESGDWSLEEMIEETREGFIAEGLIRAEIQRGIVSIYPELGWYVKSGDIESPVLIGCIKLPLREALRRIKAIGRERFERIGYEKGFAISESSPPILIEATVS